MTKEEAVKFTCENCSGRDICSRHGRNDCASIASVVAVKQEEEKESPWISVEDDLPKDNRPVYICTEDGIGRIKYRGEGQYMPEAKMWYTDEDCYIVTPDYWMPIPEFLPQNKKKKK